MTADKQENHAIKAIAEVMKTVGAVEKRGRNEFHRYDYATAADIAFALQKAMADAGLVVIATQRNLTFMGDDSIMAIEFAFMVRHISGDKLDEEPVFTGMSAARNSKGGYDDKAANKCLTSAMKYFLLNTFHIPTGEYPDADGQEDKPAAKPVAKPAPKRETQPVAPDVRAKAWIDGRELAVVTAKSATEISDIDQAMRSDPDALTKMNWIVNNRPDWAEHFELTMAECMDKFAQTEVDKAAG